MNQNKVEMESDPFNQQFKVITSDDELAFYILTPQFMEHIVAADEKVDDSQRHFGANPVWMKPDYVSAMNSRIFWVLSTRC